MRKRSRYRPKPQLPSPLAWVLNGMLPMSVAKEAMMSMQLISHGALVAITRGSATFDDVDALVGAFNLSEALADLGQGSEYMPEIKAAQAALRSAGERPRFVFSGPELNAVNTAMDVHDAQLKDSATTIDLLGKAMHIIQENIKHKRFMPLVFNQAKENHAH